MTLKSTRSREDNDAHRDMDLFDENVELRLFREAVRAKQWKKAAEFAANIDEHMTREGPIPMAWLSCEEFARLKASKSPMTETATRSHKILAGSPRMTGRDKLPTNAEFKKDKHGYVDAAPVPERVRTPEERRKSNALMRAFARNGGTMPMPGMPVREFEKWAKSVAHEPLLVEYAAEIRKLSKKRKARPVG